MMVIYSLYPYVPHLIDLSIDIVTGIRLYPNAQKDAGGGNATIIKQCFEMLVSDRTRLAGPAPGVLVSIDKIYELLEGSIPPQKRKNILDIRHRFDGDKATLERQRGWRRQSASWSLRK